MSQKKTDAVKPTPLPNFPATVTGQITLPAIRDAVINSIANDVMEDLFTVNGRNGPVRCHRLIADSATASGRGWGDIVVRDRVAAILRRWAASFGS